MKTLERKNKINAGGALSITSSNRGLDIRIGIPPSQPATESRSMEHFGTDLPSIEERIRIGVRLYLYLKDSPFFESIVEHLYKLDEMTEDLKYSLESLQMRGPAMRKKLQGSRRVFDSQLKKVIGKILSQDGGRMECMKLAGLDVNRILTTTVKKTGHSLRNIMLKIIL